MYLYLKLKYKYYYYYYLIFFFLLYDRKNLSQEVKKPKDIGNLKSVYVIRVNWPVIKLKDTNMFGRWTFTIFKFLSELLSF